MNCNLVTELQIHRFNSLFYCRAADLFHQHSKYAHNSFNVRSNSWEFICFFTVSAPTAIWTSENDFFLVPCNQTKRRQKQERSRWVLTQHLRGAVCREELVGRTHHPGAQPAWNRAGTGGNLFHIQTGASPGLNVCHRLELRAECGPGECRSLPQRREGGGGWGREPPSRTLCPLAVRLFKAELKGAEAQLPSWGSCLLPNGSSVSKAKPFAVLLLWLNSQLQC